MAKTYRAGSGTRMVNRVFLVMTRLGIGKGYRHILTVRGRKTGRPFSNPVDVMQSDGQRWLVAAYGVTSWVRNTRKAGQVRSVGAAAPRRCVPSSWGPRRAFWSFGGICGRCRSLARTSM